jgi:integration host factor subunit beta
MKSAGIEHDPQTRSSLVESIAGKSPWITSPDAKAAVDVILEAICQAVCEGRRVEIRGFGTFSRKVRSAKAGRNPKGGPGVEVLPKPSPYFKASRSLRDRVD